MKMDLNYLKKLIKMLDSSNLAEMEIVEEGTKIRLSKPKSNVISGFQSFPAIPAAQIQNSDNVLKEAGSGVKDSGQKTEVQKPENIYEVKSPMVGTFYTSPSPDADPYVKIGSIVRPGSVLCIIEAMKLMNEIESEVSGKIVQILVENAQAVEYNQTLFLIELSK